MISEELLKKVKRIEITTRRMVNDMMAGRYRSHFKGHGVQFSEHRLYMPGDDVRHIDWKVSARTRDPLVKKFEEERELTVMLLVDVSGSESFGTYEKLKSEIVAEIGGLLAYAATQTGDRVGVALFAGEVEHIVPPKKGRQHVLRVIRDLLGHQTRSKGTNLKQALDSTDRVLKHSGIVFLISDFLAQDYEISLKKLSRRHDVVAIWIEDEREHSMTGSGTILFTDPETGEEGLVDTDSYAFKQWFEEYTKRHRQQVEMALKNSKVEVLPISTRRDYGEAVVKFFRKRAKRGGG